MSTSFTTYQPSLAIRQIIQTAGIIPQDGVDDGALPIGSIRSFGGATQIVTNAVDANGQTLDTTVFANLIAVLGTSWGTSDSQNFFAPDFGGDASIGTGQGAGLTASPGQVMTSCMVAMAPAM